MGESYIEAVKKKVLAVTEEQWEAAKRCDQLDKQLDAEQAPAGQAA